MMRRYEFRRLCISGVSALAAAWACGGANMSTYTPVNEQTKFSEDSLYQAARDAADQLQYQSRADPQTHTLDTREKEIATSSIPRLSYKYSFHLETSNGVLSITAACTKNSATSEHTFSDCGDDRPERVVQELDALKVKILQLAPKVDANAPDWGNLGKPAANADAGAPTPEKKPHNKKTSEKKKPEKKTSGKPEADDTTKD